jgi:hypothetical protein
VAAMYAAGDQLWLPRNPIFFWTPSTPLKLLAHSVLRFHTHISLVLSCSDHHLSPDLRRASCPPSSATYTTPEPGSSAPRAPP